jgi:ribosome-associated protein
MAEHPGETRTIAIRDASIRLGQLLKLADLVDDGGEARAVLAQGLVEVNGEVETRRGRQLVPGDVVTMAGQTVGITSRGH